jgi:hypothetical protein
MYMVKRKKKISATIMNDSSDVSKPPPIGTTDSIRSSSNCSKKSEYGFSAPEFICSCS